MLIYYQIKEPSLNLNLLKFHTSKFRFLFYTFTLLVSCLFSILCRQTNIVWIGLMAFENLYNSSNKFRDLVHFKIFNQNVRERSHSGQNILRSPESKKGGSDTYHNWFATYFYALIEQILTSSLPFILCLLSFIAIFIYNDFNIVVGDKSAHQPTIHLAQIFYCFLFILLWNLPTLVLDLNFLFRQIKTFSDRKLEIFAVAIFLFFCQDQSKHLVHPYLLADNRHIIFYLWKNFLKYEKLRILLIPVVGYVMLASKSKLLFKMKLYPMYLMFILMVSVSVVPQLLLELRYFMVPNLFFQLYSHIRPRSTVFWNLFLRIAAKTG